MLDQESLSFKKQLSTLLMRIRIFRKCRPIYIRRLNFVADLLVLKLFQAGERVFDSIFNCSEKGDEPQCDNPGKSSTVARMVPSTREVPLSEEQETKRHSSCSFSEIFTDDLIRLVAASGGNRSKSITGKQYFVLRNFVFFFFYILYILKCLCNSL